MAQAFLIDYKWCTGCHSCEVACQILHDLPTDQFGVKVNTVGPWPYGAESWQFDNIPYFTDQCTQCVERVAEGGVPSCVQHCQAKCLKYGTLDEMVEELKANPKQLLQVM